MASGHYTYPMNDERELRFDRLMAEFDDINTKADLLDAALKHLEESIANMEGYDGDPVVAKEFQTSIVRPRYRTWLELNKP